MEVHLVLLGAGVVVGGDFSFLAPSAEVQALLAPPSGLPIALGAVAPPNNLFKQLIVGEVVKNAHA
jgi:hypothetical protein